MLVLAIVAAAWPRGWVLTRMTWTDPSGSGSAETSALVIGRPWWIGGWFPAVTWSSVARGEWSTVDSSTTVTMVDALWMSDGRALWSRRFLGRGQLGVIGPARGRRIDGAEWEKLITEYVKRAATESAASSARDQQMSISAPVPPWAEFPTAPLR